MALAAKGSAMKVAGVECVQFDCHAPPDPRGAGYCTEHARQLPSLAASVASVLKDATPMKVAVVMVNDGVKCVEAFNPEAEDEQAIRNRHYQEQVADFQKRRPGANPQDHFLAVGFVHVHIHEVKL